MLGSEYVYGTSKILVNFLFGFERSCKNMLDSGFPYFIVSTGSPLLTMLTWDKN